MYLIIEYDVLRSPNVSICHYLGLLYRYHIFIYIIYQNPYMLIYPGKLNCIVIYYDLILF